MPPVLNRELLEHLYGEDHLYVVADQPRVQGNHYTVRINLDGQAAVIDKHRAEYPGNHCVGEIRKGKGGLWLLSGGTIIFDDRGRIAIGLRDGNAADVFAFTNIGAGRCDRKLADHCSEEFESEFLLCVQKRPNGDWFQVRFGLTTPVLAEVRERIQAIAKWKRYVTDPALIAPDPAPVIGGMAEPDKIMVEWYDARGIQEAETLTGYVLEDSSNHTVEFRLPVKIDLSSYHAVEIFFAEGAGYALWMTPGQIAELGGLGEMWGSRFVTPLLENIAGRV